MDNEYREAQRLFEFRLLALERMTESQESRVRAVELQVTAIDEKLDDVEQKTDRIDARVEVLHNDRYKNIWGFVILLLTIIGTFLAEHLTAAGAPH